MTQNYEHGKLHSYKKEPIAIIGIGCRLPGGVNSPEDFWKLLRDGVDAITEVPANRWHLDTFYNPDAAEPGKIYSRWGGFIEHIDQFDAKFFGISRQEAAYIDPQQRILLEVVWEALEDAGQVPEHIAGTRIGVFIGVSNHDYCHLQLEVSNRNLLNAYSITGLVTNMVANRISYSFNFQGPSMVIDTACSSSLVSVHLACQSLWNGDCTTALAGGVNVILKPEATIGMSRAFLFSADGRCKSFDAHADGFVRAEGSGIIVLKPLSNALADNDPIYAVIRSIVVNQDGSKEGIMAPKGLALEAAIQEAYQQAGISPEQVQYVEAQGTGSPVGDVIEANAIGTVVGKHRLPGDYCFVGSVKTNIGHLESAAGITSLIKTALALKHGQIPPSLHFQTPNPKILFEELRLRVPQSLKSWPETGNTSRFAGVNSYAIGGTNAHLVLESVNILQKTSLTQLPNAQIKEKASVDRQLQIFPLSARSHEALLAFARAYLDFLADEDSSSKTSLLDICYTASLRRSHHKYRLALLVRSKKDLMEQLKSFLSREINLEPVNTFFNGSTKEDKKTEEAFLLENISKSYISGHSVDWNSLYPQGGRFVRLPTYPWQRSRYWHETEASQEARLGKPHQSQKSLLNQLIQHLENSDDVESQQLWQVLLAVPPDQLLLLLKPYLEDLVSKVQNSTPLQEDSVSLLQKQPKFLQKLNAAPLYNRKELLQVHICSQVAKVLDLDPSKALDIKQGFFNLGMDSLKSVELRNQLKISLGCSLPASLAFDCPTIEALVNYLIQELPSLGLTSNFIDVQNVDENAKLSATLEELSKEELANLLAQELAAIEESGLY
jgi:acyl transferase domain-containing protein/acyl carrier protein